MNRTLSTAVVVCLSFSLLLPPAAFAATITTQAIGADSARDQEPVVIGQRLGTTDYILSAWMKWTPLNPSFPSVPSVPQIKVASNYASNLSSYSAPATLIWSCGSSTPISGDPFFSENPYTGGHNPKRVYLVGTSYCTDSGDTFFYSPAAKNRITVWKSDDAGATWSEFAALSETTRTVGSTGTYWFADKPSISVSWEPNQTLGEVYVAHMSFEQVWSVSSNKYVGGGKRIKVFRWNPTTGFVNTATIDPGTAGAHSPIILTNPNNAGWVHLVWLDPVNNLINAAFSADYGVTWSTRSTPSGTLVNGTISRGGVAFDGVSMLMARFNPQGNTVGIVWHARNNDIPANVDVKFITFDSVRLRFGARQTVTAGPNYWVNYPFNIDSSTPGDQFNPALDYDANGNYLITYYDIPDSATTFQYRVKAASLAPSGGRLSPPVSDLDVSPVYDGSLYPERELRSDGKVKYNRSLGEYMDVWNWFGNWYSIYIGANATSDPYVAKIVP